MFDISKFLDIFIVEAEEHIQKLDDNLLLLEKKFTKKEALDGDLLNELMRSAHTIKSSAATMGYAKMAYLTHVLEDVFDYARYDQIKLSSGIIKISFDCVDALRSSLKSIKKNGKESDVEAIAKKIKKITGVATDGIGKSVRDASGRPQLAKKSEPKTKSASAPSVENDFVGERINFIKVPVERLDKLLDLTEEMLVHRLRLLGAIRAVSEHPDDAGARENNFFSIKDSAVSLSALIDSLQFEVMQSRLVPVGQVFSRFPRMVRDLAESQKKKIDFNIIGDELEIDRSIVDRLSEPVGHLLRNAIDHGVAKNGAITLLARRDKDRSVISVTDDGAGINWQKVVDVAAKRGIIDPATQTKYLEALRTLDKTATPSRDIVKLIYHPNLSTKEAVTETSGRGVGLSVVAKFIASIGGSVDAISPVNEKGGTEISMHLPLTLTIITALLVRVGDVKYAIPFSTVERAVAVTPDDIKSMADQDVAVIEGVEVPLVSLQSIFHHEKSIEKAVVKTVVLVRSGKDLAGIVVDKLLSQQEIIIKPLPKLLEGVRGFGGSTVLEQGEAVLIIDVHSLLEDTNQLLRVK